MRILKKQYSPLPTHCFCLIFFQNTMWTKGCDGQCWLSCRLALESLSNQAAGTGDVLRGREAAFLGLSPVLHKQETATGAGTAIIPSFRCNLTSRPKLPPLGHPCHVVRGLCPQSQSPIKLFLFEVVFSLFFYHNDRKYI